MEHDDLEAKFWLSPSVSLAYTDGYNARTLRGLMNIVQRNRLLIIRTWNACFASLKRGPSRRRPHVCELSDGRSLGIPLAWFSRLLHGSPAQRDEVRLSSRGLHWEALDEDISIAGLLAGYGDQTVGPAHTAA